MVKDFDLSKKRLGWWELGDFYEADVLEFVRRVKEVVMSNATPRQKIEKIDELLGNKKGVKK